MTKKGEITGVSVNDLSNVELRIMAANLKHAQEGGPVPALRLGERTEAPDGTITGKGPVTASADAWRNLPNSKDMFK